VSQFDGNPDDDGGFDELGLIESRIREAMATASKLAAHLSRLGAEAHAAIISLDEEPVISVFGFFLTPDEASEMIRRLDPKWSGQTCERDWDSLPTDDTLANEKKKESIPPAPSASVPPPPASSAETLLLAGKILAAAQARGMDTGEAGIRRRAVAAAMNAMRRKRKNK
jgi:hypothetical protein